MAFRVWAETHNGAVRKHNEDALVSRPEIGLWAVADGAGGHASGEVASGMLAETLREATGRDADGELSAKDMLADLRARVGAVHDALKREATRRGEGSIIASTIVILLIRAGHFACLWAGDSRAYLLRGGVLQQVTRDHSLVQELVEAGVITAAQAEGHPQANVITRAVGSYDDLELEKVSGKLEPGDRFLLCSDGLCKTLNEADLAHFVQQDGGAGPGVELIAAALERDVRDNVTAVVVEFAPDDPAEDAADDGRPD
jgi:protein phosphatase/serine/threonine-protein phosphatase Stp1